MTPEQILALVATLLSGTADDGFPKLAAGGYDARYPVTVAPCPRPLPARDIEGSTLICGEVSVPENYDHPEGRRIGLKFAVMKAISESPQPDPVVYLHGGPGGRAVPDMQGYDRAFARFREDRDIVLFDQRASGISDATVTCFETLADNLFALAGKEEVKGDPVKTCLEELQAGGTDLPAYNTTSNAHDVRALTLALGYPVYNAYGASYGTLLGQEIMRSAPDGLRAIILDSVALTFGRGYDGNQLTIDKTIGSIVDRCLADAACGAAFPDLETDVRNLGQVLTDHPIPATLTRPEITVQTLRDLWGQRNQSGLPGIDPYLPMILTEWAHGTSRTWDLYKLGALSPQLGSASIAAMQGKVDTERLIIGYAVALQAEQLRSLDTSIQTLLSQLSITTANPPVAQGLEKRLDARLSELATAMDHDTLLALGKSYGRFVRAVPTREALSDWVAQYFQGPDLAELQAMISVMTDADLVAFHARAVRDTGKYYKNLADGYFDLAIYACQESVPFNSRAGYAEIAKTYRFPWVDDGELESFYALCDAFPHLDRPGFHDPVVSDIPVLATQGLQDTQTDNDAATRVAATLSRAQVVTFDQSGHGVLLFSQCAKDIMAAFIDHPEQQANAACAGKQKVKFVVPEAAKN